jgi:hypothetical protein
MGNAAALIEEFNQMQMPGEERFKCGCRGREGPPPAAPTP